MKAALLALLISQVSGVDGGAPEKPVIYRISKPSLVPAPGYYYPDAAHEAVNEEMKRLQWIEANPPKVSVEGYLIGMALTFAVGLISGVVAGYVLKEQLEHK